MTSTPPDPQSRRDRQAFDELIAVAVALLGIGSVFFWALSQQEPPFRWGSLIPSPSPIGSPVPPVSPTPSVEQPSRAIIPAPTGSPTAAPQPIPPVRQEGAAPAIVPLPIVPQPSPAPTVAASPTPAAPVPAQPAAPTPVNFSDVPADFWAAPFITELSQREIIAGFQDNTFRSDKPVTRAEFAKMLQEATEQPRVRQPIAFTDVPPDFWAATAISEATQTGFIRGYPDGSFRPNQLIPKTQALVSAASGLGLPNPAAPAEVLRLFQDGVEVPNYALGRIAAATQANLVVNYPNRDRLNPSETMTRADAAALVYQMLVQQGKATPIDSPYLVKP